MAPPLGKRGLFSLNARGPLPWFGRQPRGKTLAYPKRTYSDVVRGRTRRRAARAERRSAGPVRAPLLGHDQDCPEVVDVGQRRTGDHLIAQRLEEAVAVVVGEALLGVDARRFGAGERVRGH